MANLPNPVESACTVLLRTLIAAGISVSAAFTGGHALAAEAPATAQTGEKTGEVFDDLSDSQLTDLAADWQQLDASARADLIAETRERMQPSQRAESAGGALTPRQVNTGAVAGSQGRPGPQITLRTQQRRYGRVVRKADGSLLRIETRVVTVRRRDPKRAFGVGFERRQRQHGQQPTTAGVPLPPVPVTGRSAEATPGVVTVTETLD